MLFIRDAQDVVSAFAYLNKVIDTGHSDICERLSTLFISIEICTGEFKLAIHFINHSITQSSLTDDRYQIMLFIRDVQDVVSAFAYFE